MKVYQKKKEKKENFSQAAITEKWNIGIAGVNQIIAGSAYKKVCVQWMLDKARNEDSKSESVSAISPFATTARVMIFCTALSEVKRVGFILTIGNEKRVTWISSP